MGITWSKRVKKTSRLKLPKGKEAQVFIKGSKSYQSLSSGSRLSAQLCTRKTDAVYDSDSSVESPSLFAFLTLWKRKAACWFKPGSLQ